MITRQLITKLSIVCLGLVLIGTIVLLKCHYMGKTQDTEIITARLNDIQLQLSNLQQAAKKPDEKVDLSAINQDFNKLTKLIEQLKSKDDNTISQLINENRAELSQKMDALHEVINSLDKKQHSIKYLPVTALPFKVISIDSIQQVSVVTVTYDFKTIPLEKSDKLAGWTVLQIDFGQQRIELENSNKEHVVVTMEADRGDQNA
jgi:seryl-tRNA synthetase